MADTHASNPVGAHDSHAHAVDHSHDAEHVAKHVKGYLLVGLGLMVLTGITVLLSYVDFGSHGRNIIVAMIVATFKAGLVAAIFMHLKGERATIWRFLIFTAIFAAGLFLLTWLHEADPIQGTFRAIR
jgi:cytochrome c oxidase subunit IV